MAFVKKLVKRALEWTRPLAWKIAGFYDLKIERHCHPTGQHPIEFEDDDSTRRHNIPKSVVFNTRSGTIYVGKNTVFGDDVFLLTGKHLSREEAERSGLPHHHVPDSGRDIRIGRDCYLGSGVIVIGPVSIGDGAVIGAGAVVTKSVPAGAFAAGVPARVVSKDH